MSWLDRITDSLTITTGEGSTFTPNWINASRQKEYNIAEFEFIEQKGTLVSRKLPRGNKYNIEIYFQGDDHLNEAGRFDLAADDPRYWVIAHPFYGRINVQPLSLSFDNSIYNITKITGIVMETIVEDFPIGFTDPIASILLAKTNLDIKTTLAFTNAIPEPTTQVTNTLRTNVNSFYSLSQKLITATVDAQEYYQKYSDAIRGVNNITGQVSLAMTMVTDFINAPINFALSVKQRISMVRSQFDTLRTSVMNVFNNSPALFNSLIATTYENNAGSIASIAAIISITNMDYKNRSDVFDVVEEVLSIYNTFVADLDTFQSANGGSPTSYVPNADSMTGLNSLVNDTIATLFAVGVSSKQERIIYLETESNLVVVAHRVYGLLPDDSTIQTLIDNNKIGLNELLILKKDRKIIYYV